MTPGRLPRLPRLPRSALSDEQRALHDEIAGGRRAAAGSAFALTDEDGGLVGPFTAMLLSPPVGAALQGLGVAVRYRSALPGRLREMAVLLVATRCASAFERHAHEAVGRAEGLVDTELAALRAGEVPSTATPTEALALRTVLALLDRGDLDDDEYAAACGELGERQVFELTTLVGYYALLALQLRVFRVDPPRS